jgi:regulator of sigma E protease
MSFLWYLASFLLALAVLIVVHEMGHLLVARWCGVQVLRFSVGFGRPLLSRRWGRDNTEWVVSAFPLGGYVKMLDERESSVPEALLHRAFNRQPVLKRVAIVSAGPVANLGLAVIIYFGIFMTGVMDMKPLLSAPKVGSIAAAAGFQGGEVVTMVDGQKIVSWTELRKQLLQAVLDQKSVSLAAVDANGDLTVRTLSLSGTQFDDMESDPAGKLGFQPFVPPHEPVIGSVSPGSPARSAGMQAGDRVLSVNGEPVTEWQQVVGHIRPAFGKSLTIEISREDERIKFQVVPALVMESGEAVGRLGIAVKPDDTLYEGMMVNIRHGPIGSLSRALHEVWYISALSLRMMGRMITGEVSLKNLSGPVTIADYAGQSAHLGISPYLRFIALISISLGVLNLLPIPILDGGHLMYYLIELFKGSPVSDRAVEIGQKIGVGVLGSLMLLALYNDFHRLISG